MLVIEAFEKVAAQFAFRNARRRDSDDDSTFMRQVGFDCCKGRSLEQARSRACRVGQTNGAVVRPLRGDGRLSGREATTALSQLYESSRLYSNPLSTSALKG